MKYKIAQLLSFIIICSGLAAIALLTAAVAAELISTGVFIFWMAVSVAVCWRDVVWIDRHFVDGEWI